MPLPFEIVLNGFQFLKVALLHSFHLQPLYYLRFYRLRGLLSFAAGLMGGGLNFWHVLLTAPLSRKRELTICRRNRIGRKVPLHFLQRIAGKVKTQPCISQPQVP